MTKAEMRDKLEREIQRMENHLDVLYDILEEFVKEAPRRKAPENVNDRIPLMEKAIAKVRGNRVFTVKEITDFALHIDPTVERRIIYNCLKSYLQREAGRGKYELITNTEFKRI